MVVQLDLIKFSHKHDTKKTTKKTPQHIAISLTTHITYIRQTDSQRAISVCSNLSLLTDDRDMVVQLDIMKETLQKDVGHANQVVVLLWFVERVASLGRAIILQENTATVTLLAITQTYFSYPHCLDLQKTLLSGTIRKTVTGKRSKCSNDPYSACLQGFFAVISPTKMTIAKAWAISCHFTTEWLHKF